jgi:phage-related protein
VPRRQTPRLECRFYRSDSGVEPVRDWIRRLGPAAAKAIGSDIKDVQWRWPVGMPLVRPLGRGLYEVRSTHMRNEYRVLFCIEEREMVLLHGFQKKRQATPQGDIELARQRMG